MQLKFTLNQRRRNLFGLSPLFLILFFLVAGKINAQQYVNGNLSTGATSSNGAAAPAGFTWSEVQAGNGTAGFGNNITNFTLADDFTIAAGSWNLTKITFYAYSTGFAGGTSPYNDVRVAIYNTNPSVGNPAPIYGDLTTNRFLASSTASMYRIFNATPGTTRQIWKIEATVATVLNAGTYWIEWGVGNGGLSNFSPASTVVGTVTQPGNNALQHTIAGNTWANANDGTNPQDFPFIIDYTTGACTGTPAPGNTLSTASTVCPGISFTLSLQNGTAGSGVTYQWQSSPDGTTWTNITGATNASYTTTLTATTQYRCNVTCSGNTGTSTPVTVALTPPSNCYCTPPASDCTDDDVITRVRISTLDNASSCGTGPPAGYSNYTTTVAAPTVYSGAANPITVDAPATWTEGVCVWIDYNQNGQFETTEYTSLGNKPAGQTSVTGNIAIPSTALNGTTRMRVRIRFGGVFTNTQACTGSTFSETEDYNVTIAPCVPVTITGAPSSSTIVCGASTSFTVTTAGTLPAYSWQYRTSASGIWQTVTNGGIYSGATTATLTLTDVSQAFSGYQYRALVTGGCSAVDFTSPPATLTVNAIVPVVNPASATICAGSVQQLSLTNSVSAPVTAVFNASAGLPLAIPDNNPTGANNTLVVSGIPAGAVVTEMKVRFSVPAHTWAGDLCAVIRAPNNQILNLDYFISATGAGPTGSGMVNTTFSSLGGPLLSSTTSPYTGTFRADAVTAGAPAPGPTGFAPTTNLWTALYSTLNGNYTLAMYDGFGGDVGSLTAWSIEITYVSPALAQGTWNGPAGTMFTDAGATVPYTGTPATSIYVKPTATTNNYTVSFTTPIPCTSATTTVPVNVSNPATGLTVTPATRSVCLGGSTTFTASTTGGNPIAYQWQVSTDGGLTYNNITGATSATLTVSGVTQAMSGNRYRFTVTSAPCTPAVVSASIGTLTVNPLPTVTLSSPVVSLIPGRTTTITGTSTPAAAAGGWSWTLNGSAIGGTTNTQTVSIDGLGSYQATVTDVNGCVNTSNTIDIGAEASDKLWIYPNPTTGAFQVRLYYAGGLAEKRVVTIYNPLGQAITSREFTLVSGVAPYLQMDFDLGGVKAKGTYVVKVADHFTGKVISGLVLVQ